MLKKLLSALFPAALALNAGVVVTTQVADFAGRPVRMDFDSIAAGTDITGQIIDGVKYVGPNAALLVVAASSTFTPAGSFAGTTNINLNKLPATSGLNVLSPGGAMLGPGPNPSIEGDSLTLEFQTPVTYFGFDLLSQSADGVSFASIKVFDPNSNLLYSGKLGISDLGGGGAPGGADFWGIWTTAGTTIGRVEILEGDDDAMYPDSNIGYDSLRYGVDAPEPGSLLMMAVGGGFLAISCRRQRLG
jgi:hypothetical protein